MKPGALEYIMELYKEGRARREAMLTVLEDLAENPPVWSKIASDILRGDHDGSRDYARSTIYGEAKSAEWSDSNIGAAIGAALGGAGGYMNYLGGRRPGDPSDWGGWAKNVLGGAALGGVGGGLLGHGVGSLRGPGDPRMDPVQRAQLELYGEDAENNPIPGRNDELKSVLGAEAAEAGVRAAGFGTAGALMHGGRKGMLAALPQGVRFMANQIIPESAAPYTNPIFDFISGYAAVPGKAPAPAVGDKDPIGKMMDSLLKKQKGSGPSAARLAKDQVAISKALASTSGASKEILRRLDEMMRALEADILVNPANVGKTDAAIRQLASAKQRVQQQLNARSTGKKVMDAVSNNRRVLGGLAGAAGGAFLDIYGKPRIREIGSEREQGIRNFLP